MENTYKILGNKNPIKGASLQIALEKAGFTYIRIVPLWHGNSDGSYKVYCREETIMLVHWIEKRNKLSLPCHN